MAKKYNIYEYGTSPRKLQPEYTPNKKQKTNKKPNNKTIKKDRQNKQDKQNKQKDKE